MSENVGIIPLSVIPWSSPFVIVPKKAEPATQPEKHLCVDYCALNSVLLPVVKVHSKAQGVLSFVPLPKINELYIILNGSTLYSSLGCTSGYHHIALSTNM